MAGIDLRQQGVYAENLPTKSARNVRASDFLIGGIIGIFERAFDKAFVVTNMNDFRTIFGENFSSAAYGWNQVEAFFKNTRGVAAKLYVKSHVGCSDAVTIDAVVASKMVTDQEVSPKDLLKIEAAFQGELQYGLSGNRTAVTTEVGDRSTTTAGAASLPSDTFFYAKATSDIKPGDIITVVATGGGGATVWHKVGSVEESTGKVNLVDAAGAPVAFHGTAFPQIADVVSVKGFKLHVFKKNTAGRIVEMQPELGARWLSTESDNVEFFVENVYNPVSTMVKITRQSVSPAPTWDKIMPQVITDPLFLASGSNGTAPSTLDHWQRDIDKLNNLPVRFVSIVETTNETVQQGLETAMKGRVGDEPKVFFCTPKNQTFAQLQTIGRNFQRSDEVLGYVTHEWIKIDDPFNTALNAPLREVPNCGFLMGAYIRSIGLNGIHYSPAVRQNALIGVRGLVNDNLGNISETERTELLKCGINLIQNIEGSGYILRSLNTPCTQFDYVFSNAGVMKSFFKVSAVESMAQFDNEPNNYDRITSGRDALYTFFVNMALKGSTGAVPSGETFGQQQGQELTDTFEIVGDLTNNPMDGIQRGERNYDGWFQRPAPTGSLRVRFGILIPA